MTAVDWEAYEEHLKWFDDGIKYRLRLRPQWTAADITSLEEDNPEEEAYNANIRETKGEFREYAPLIKRVSFELNRSIFEGSNALVHAPGTAESDSALREMTKKFMMRCRKLVGMLGCASSVDVHAPGPSTHATRHIVASSSHAGTASSSHAASSSHHIEEPEEDEEEEDVEQADGSDEGDEEEYDEGDDEDDGPPPTQPTQEKKSLTHARRVIVHHRFRKIVLVAEQQ